MSSGMSSPTRGDLQRLKRVARYRIGRPTVTWRYDWQQPGIGIKVFTDADWAGCTRTRRSTSGGAIMRGRHLLKCWGKSQQVVSLSSGEVELYAGVRAASEGLGVRSLMEDFGEKTRMQLVVDATAAMAMLSREGLGRAKHIDTQCFWVQEKVKSRDFEIVKVASAKNPSDLFTKQLPEGKVIEHLGRMGCEFGN